MAQKGSIDALKAPGAETPNPTGKGKPGKKGLKNTRIETPFYFRNGRVSIVNIPVHVALSTKLPQVTEEQVASLKADGTLKNAVAVKHGKSIKIEYGAAGNDGTKEKKTTLMVPNNANNSDISHHLKKLNADFQTDINWFQQGNGRKIWVKKLDQLAQAAAGG